MLDAITRYLYFTHPKPTNFILFFENAVVHEGEDLAYHLDAVAQNASDLNCF